MGAPLRKLTVALATAAVAALGAAVLVQVHRHGSEAVGGRSAAAAWLQLAAALATWAAGLDLALRGRARLSGALLAAAGPALLLGAVPLPSAGGALLFTAALLGGAGAAPLAGSAGLLHPAPARRLDVVVAGAAVAGAIVVLGLVATAAFDPRAAGCFDCPRNLLLVHGDVAFHDTLIRDGLWAQAALCAALAALTLVRWARRPGLVRAAVAPVAAGGAIASTLGAASFAHAAHLGAPQADNMAQTLWLALSVVLLVEATGVGIQTVRARLLRDRIADIVAETLPTPERLRAALATGLGDPRLTIAFPTARDGAVDAEGRAAGPPGHDVAITEVTRGRDVIAELRHDPGLAQASERVAAAARGAGLALEHASLHARLRAELAHLRASRVRIVEVGDGERRRLERDLHDGAQQRLIALSVALRNAGDDPALARAGRDVTAALEELRELARGIHPVSLTDAGIEAALRTLGESSRVPLRLSELPAGRFPPAVEAAVHRLVLDAVGCAERSGDGRAVAVHVSREADALRARVTVPGVDPAAARLRMEHAADRIAALDGELDIHAGESGVVCEARIPCAS